MREHKCEWGGAQQRERYKQTPMFSLKPDAGLDPTTLRS